jgi:hypothetical protein
VLVRDRARELDLVHQWLDTWAGLGLVVAGMTHQGWDVQLTAYAARDWRANFFPVGIAHSIVGGTAWEPTTWRAVQGAARSPTTWSRSSTRSTTSRLTKAERELLVSWIRRQS